MKKPKHKFLIIILSGIIILLIFAKFYFDAHFIINNEYSAIYFLRGGYRSWGVNYGHTFKNGKWPEFYHHDTRNLLKKEKYEKADPNIKIENQIEFSFQMDANNNYDEVIIIDSNNNIWIDPNYSCEYILNVRKNINL